MPGVFKEGKISFPDGNVWPKEAGVSGVYLDPQHKEGYRVVRATSPSTVQIVLQDDPKAEVLKLAGTSATDEKNGGDGDGDVGDGNGGRDGGGDGCCDKLAGTSATDEKKGETTIKIDFSVKGGPKDVPGVYKDDKISFPDGNVWSKL